MTHFYKARMRAAKLVPILNDLRAVYYDDVGVPMHELKKLENDPNYLPSPKNLVKILNYYHDQELFNDVCRNCPISICTENLISFVKSFNYDTPSSRSRFLNRFKKIKQELVKQNENKTIF